MAASNSSSGAGKTKSGTTTNPLEAMGAFFSKQVDQRKLVTTEKRALATCLSSSGDMFLGSEHLPADQKRWMAELGVDRLRMHQVVWLGTHDSATNKIGVPFVTRPFDVRIIDVRV